MDVIDRAKPEFAHGSFYAPARNGKEPNVYDYRDVIGRAKPIVSDLGQPDRLKLEIIG